MSAVFRVEFACAVSIMLDAKEVFGTTPTTIGFADAIDVLDDG